MYIQIIHTYIVPTFVMTFANISKNLGRIFYYFNLLLKSRLFSGLKGNYHRSRQGHVLHASVACTSISLAV